MNSQVRNLTLPEIDGVFSTYQKIRKWIPRSPLIKAPSLGPNCWLKLETLMPTGSFKVRGAFASLLKISDGTSIVSCSAGNHGLALAYAATKLKAKACIVVSEAASPRKIELLKQSSVELVIQGANYDQAEDYARGLAEIRNAYYLSPYNDPEVILGQASVGLEILELFSEEVTVVSPIGGGGLLAGVGMALSTRPGSIAIGVEAENSAPMKVALKMGEVTKIPIGRTVADGLAGNLEDGTITLDLLQRYAPETLTVSEKEIHDAMGHLADHYGILSEGAGAVGIASVLSGKVTSTREQPLVVLVTGRNVRTDTWVDILYNKNSII
ncbi:pyridoxal-phosphate dependent protein [Leptospira perolatii]|uniref:Pyridoxal-phosphate dependent protein n=1 Tax=Leptospira perolatii TaxID=2023191 RepID=A0A2M9ZQH2_9LEPT|nr:pyridoxal-phosphate dependent enzyme [Leptospira perolatii]PJZ70486.1 pyridoxal-phosphate dependent protein [Leptospira perolatii]PJZ74322.1 pyridoxal-phosphate dependent protein [Leptospira perolatii]